MCESAYKIGFLLCYSCFSDGQRALFGRMAKLEMAVERNHLAISSAEGARASSPARRRIQTPSDRSVLENLPLKSVATLESWANRVNSSPQSQEAAVSKMPVSTLCSSSLFFLLPYSLVFEYFPPIVYGRAYFNVPKTTVLRTGRPVFRDFIFRAIASRYRDYRILSH